jgi:hypothetical protein
MAEQNLNVRESHPTIRLGQGRVGSAAEAGVAGERRAEAKAAGAE